MTRVEQWGTFEVANFGDLLYPLLLEQALRGAVEDLDLRLAGPIGGTVPMGIGHPVRRAVRHDEPGFWAQARDVDAVVLGGGDLVHAGTGVVELDGRIDRIDSWPFAVEFGYLADVRPAAWNAVGVPFDVAPELAPGLRAACARIDLLAVRDEGSRQRLEAAGVEQEIQVVADTGVLIDQLVPEPDRRGALDALRAAGQLPPEPFLLVHVSFVSPSVLAELAAALRASLAAHPHLRPVLVALGPTHGDGAILTALAEQLEQRAWVLPDPTVVEVAAVLGAAELVVSSSYHATIVASVFGVPALTFSHQQHQPAKTRDLAVTLGRERWLLSGPAEIPAAVAAVQAGAGRPDGARVADAQASARAHLARIAAVISGPPRQAVDLAERDAAHQRLVDSLQTAHRREAIARRELTLLRAHHARAMASAREHELLYWRVSGREDPNGPGEDDTA